VFVSDKTGPQLSAFDVDISTRIMTLQYDEPVQTQSFSAKTVTLQSRAAEGAVAYTLTAGSVASTADQTAVVVLISEADMAKMIQEYNPLLTSKGVCVCVYVCMYVCVCACMHLEPCN
jgi:hypothetical protein